MRKWLLISLLSLASGTGCFRTLNVSVKVYALTPAPAHGHIQVSVAK